MDLQAMFSQGNPFLAQMAEQQWNTEQQKRQQDLQTALQASQRAQELHPLEMAGKKAGTAYNQALTDETQLRIQQKMRDSFSKLKDDEREAVSKDMAYRHQLASAIEANNGVIPLELQGRIPKEEMDYYTGPNLAKTLSLTRAFIQNNPEWLQTEAKEGAKQKRTLAEIDARGQWAQRNAATRAANTPAKATGTEKMSLEQYLTYLNRQIAGMPEGPDKEAVKAEADRTELQLYRKQAEIAKARAAGTVDPGATSEAGKVVTKPEYVPTPTPRQQQWTPPAGWK